MKTKYEDRSKVLSEDVTFKVDIGTKNKILLEMNGKKMKIGKLMREILAEHFDGVDKFGSRKN